MLASTSKDDSSEVLSVLGRSVDELSNEVVDVIETS
jgi:hypothetical protein